MKRSKMLKIIEDTLDENYSSQNNYNDIAAKEILKAIEEAGILPPVQSPSFVEDTYNGGLKHGPSMRVWDEE